MNGYRPYKSVEQPGTMGSVYSLGFIALALVLLVPIGGNGATAEQPTGLYPRLIEVFTTSERPVVGNSLRKTLTVSTETEIQTYELDGIQRFEARLSHDLPADPKQARRITLQRLQKWGETTNAQMQQAATGLAKAIQYGIDRYPAIVFDGDMVVYGLTDLSTALDHYRTWRAGARP